MTALPGTAHDPLSDRRPMTDPRDDAIRELVDHNLAIRRQLAMLRADAAHMPGPRIPLLGAKR